jgi:hypothetical protein
MVLLNQLANADQESLHELSDKLDECPGLLREWLVELMPLVAKIPYHCGKPDCQNDGCFAIRQARAVLDDILEVANRKD